MRLAHVAAVNVLEALVVTTPSGLRAELRGGLLMNLIDRYQCLCSDTATDYENAATKLPLRSTANRVRQLTVECREFELAMIHASMCGDTGWQPLRTRRYLALGQCHNPKKSFQRGNSC